MATFDKATQDFIDQNFGSEAAWYNDPQIGPVLKEAVRLGLQGARYQDFIRTHAVDTTGAVVQVPADQSWFGKNAAPIRTAMAQKTTDIASYNKGIQDMLESYVIPNAKTLGLKLDDATLKKVAEDAYVNKWSGYQIQNALTSQYHYDTTKPVTGGTIGKTTADFVQIAKDYGVALPKDPATLEQFIKDAAGAGGTEDAFTEYAKSQAKLQFPWLAASIDAGIAPKTALTPIAVQIGNLLDINPNVIDWTDPKWANVLSTTDPKTGAVMANSNTQILSKVKTDPVFDYDHSQTAINDAYALGKSIKSMMGFSA
jgi:hypothetical protein